MHHRTGATVDGNKRAQAKRHKTVTTQEIADALCSGKCPPLKVLHAAAREGMKLHVLQRYNSGVTGETVATVKRATITAMGPGGVATTFLTYLDSLTDSARLVPAA